MDWFKTMTTNAYIRGVKNDGWRRFDDKLWQRNYYDHIIRDWQDDVRISTYIIDNPAKWDDDKFNNVQ
jgi:putative transposase